MLIREIAKRLVGGTVREGGGGGLAVCGCCRRVLTGAPGYIHVACAGDHGGQVNGLAQDERGDRWSNRDRDDVGAVAAASTAAREKQAKSGNPGAGKFQSWL